MSEMRALRYLAPNLITTANLVFGMLSVAATAQGEFANAGWFIIYAVLGDRLDGFVARLVRGTSELGVQLDSFADFFNFGVAPAYLVYMSIGTSPVLGFTEGNSRTLLMIACAIWILAATFRLARYNITDDPPMPGPIKIFFGVPTTLAAGLLVSWYLALYKYAPVGSEFPALPEPFGGPRWLLGVETPNGVWGYIPVAMLIGAYLMASTLRIPKLGVMRSKIATVILFAFVFGAAICGFARVYPEYIILPATTWLVVFMTWGCISPAARSIKPPPIFPPVDPPPGREPVRPEDDLLPEDSEASLDDPPVSDQDKPA